ncbi:MAG: thiamine pyrophosphate-binding protein [Myxococcota bacterium]|nr:thiamine pyrophosphate-binding protein [Myxococcota bacterium]MDW8363113.1 thiamine pyrophosphate-binding protein [Myxococcales bacterium]
MHGGDLVARVLVEHGIDALFTLCGGHISPILVGAKRRGVRVVDTRHEASAVFAADAWARLTGRVGVAAVTAGPGVTNTVTAVKNAQMAESPLLVLGGATATLLRGRGALQDIDQMSILAPVTKWATRVTTYRALAPTIERALRLAREGVPGPVFVEVPIDLLYPESTVRDWTLKEFRLEGLAGQALRAALRAYLYRQFHQPHLPLHVPPLPDPIDWTVPGEARSRIDEIHERLGRARRPVLVVGSQALVNETEPERVARAIATLGVPTYLGGMARGLLGRRSEVQFRHERAKALREADFVLVAGFPFDFRLKYGQAISRRATLVAVNLSGRALRKNRIPDLAVRMHPGQFLVELGARGPVRADWSEWYSTLRSREAARDAEIERGEPPVAGRVSPLRFFVELERLLPDDAILVADGGDFVATASYILRPRGPLSWLDPGVYGTLGVGGGFALGAAAARPDREIWILWGDGSSAYSIAELDTFVRHGMSPIAVVGTDASWGQIARDQVELLGDDVGTCLRDTAYHEVARGWGGEGLLLDDESRIAETVEQARRIARSGKPVCINVLLSRSEFRKGSISV